MTRSFSQVIRKTLMSKSPISTSALHIGKHTILNACPVGRKFSTTVNDAVNKDSETV
ncbi:uncharacterized protein Dmoj_GI25895 [Drosophila mojavensis]|uniref:Uncharacterized protein n=1 Tax=Drosophila mojavensis TaxID=7230 RepID=A0A0Q9XAF8_DROMO|nr:uncharacterized protein Dmoj_GI25895 [Drosophila mojavensis]